MFHPGVYKLSLSKEHTGNFYHDGIFLKDLICDQYTAFFLLEEIKKNSDLQIYM